MKTNDWSTRKVFGASGTLISMEHTYNFQDQFVNCHSYIKNPSKYVYYNDDHSPQFILQREKSMYKSDLDYPHPWKQASLRDCSDEENNVKEEWFDYVKSKYVGEGWKEAMEKEKRRKEETKDKSSDLIIHRDKIYEDWLKRKKMKKKSFIVLKVLPRDKWLDGGNSDLNHEESVHLNEFLPNNFKTNSSYLDGLPPGIHPEVFASFPDLNFPNDVHNNIPPKLDKLLKNNRKNNSVLNVPDDEFNCDLDVPSYNDSKDYIESPPDTFTKAEPKLVDNKENGLDLEMDSSDCLIERRTIFKCPTSGIVKSFRSDTEAVLHAQWENKNVEIIFFSWVFIPKGGGKLTLKDSLKTYLKLGQTVNFHGARTIPDTDKYETFLVYDGAYPTLSERSGYDLKKWTLDKDLYTFPRRAVVKGLILPFHAVVEIEAPARNLNRKITSVAMEICFVNRTDQFHPECWIDEYVKVGDKVYVELTTTKPEGGTVSVRRVWKFPEEKIITPKPITTPNFDIPKDKFVFSCKEGKKSCVGTVSAIYPNKGIFLTNIKAKTYEIHFDQVYIDGREANLNDLQVGKEIMFRNFRKPPSCEEFWSPLVFIGPQPKLWELMRRHETESARSANIDEFTSIYVGKVERFILPSHAVIKTTSNNDLDFYLMVSKVDVLAEAPDHLWIDKIITLNDVLTFKIKRLEGRYTAISVYN